MSYRAGQPKQQYSALGSGVKPLPLGNSARRHVTVGRQAQSAPAAPGSKLPLTFGPSATSAAPPRPGNPQPPQLQHQQQQQYQQQQYQQPRPPQQPLQHSRQSQQLPPSSSIQGQGSASHSTKNPSGRSIQHQHEGGVRVQQPGSAVPNHYTPPPAAQPLQPPLQPQLHAQGREVIPHVNHQSSSTTGGAFRERPFHSSALPVEAATSAQTQQLRQAQGTGQLPTQPARGSVVNVGPTPQPIPGASIGNELGNEAVNSSNRGGSSGSESSADVSEELRRLRQEVARQRVDLAERDDALRAMVDQVQKKDEEMFDLQASLAVSEAELKASSEEAQKALAGQANFQQQDLINEQRARARLEQQLTEERAKKKHKSSSDSLDTTTGSTPSQSPRSHKSSRATPAGAAAVVAPTPTAPPSQPHPQAPLGRQVENALGNQESAASLRRDLATSACIVTRDDYAASWRMRERSGVSKLLQTDLNARTLVLWRPETKDITSDKENAKEVKVGSTDDLSVNAGYKASNDNDDDEKAEGDENVHGNATTTDGSSARCLDQDGAALASAPRHVNADVLQRLKGSAALATREAGISDNHSQENSLVSPLSRDFLAAQTLLADSHGAPYEVALSALLKSILAFIVASPPAQLHNDEINSSLQQQQQAHVPMHVSEAAWVLLLVVLRRASTSVSSLLFLYPIEQPATPSNFEAISPKDSKSSTSSSAGSRSSSGSKRKSGNSGASDHSSSFSATKGVWGSLGDALNDDFSDLCFGDMPVSRDEVKDTWLNLLEDVAACSAMGDPGLIHAGLRKRDSSPSVKSAASKEMDVDPPSTSSTTATSKESSSSLSTTPAESQSSPISDLAVSLRGAVLTTLRHPQLSSPLALQSALLVLQWCLLTPPPHTPSKSGATKSTASTTNPVNAGVAQPCQRPLEFWAALIDPSDGIYLENNSNTSRSGGISREPEKASDNRQPSDRSSNSNSSGNSSNSSKSSSSGDRSVATEPLFVLGGILGAVLSCDALPSADHELLAVQVLGCLLPLPNLFRLSTSHPALSSSSMLSGSTAGATLRTPHALNDSTAMNTSIGSAASPSSLNSATPADLISTLCKLMLRRSSPQPDSLRDGSSNGRLNEDAIENRLLSEVAASHRVCREVVRLLGLVLSLHRHGGGLDAILAPRSLKDKAQDGEVLVEGENLLCLCTGLRHTFAVLREEIDHELGYNRGPFPHVSPTDAAASSSSKSADAKGSSSSDRAAADNAACASAIAELRAAHWDNDLWALRASHIALLREGIVLVTQDLVIQGLEERWSMTLHEVLRGHLGAWPLHSLASKLLNYAHSTEALGTTPTDNGASSGGGGSTAAGGAGITGPGLSSGCAELMAVEEDLKYLIDQCAEPMSAGNTQEEDSATEVDKLKGAAESCESSEFDLFADQN